MRVIFSITQITFLEVVRQRFFNFLLLLALVFSGSSLFFQQFNFGSSELKFIYDLGSGTVLFFGTLLGVLLTAQLIFTEIENKTALTILARPVHRLQFLLGKFLGIWLLMWVFVLVVTSLLGVILFFRESALLHLTPDLFPDGRHTRYGDLLIFGLIQGVRLGVISAMTLFFTALSRSTMYAMVISFMGVMICQLQYIAQEATLAGRSWFYSAFLQIIQLVFPNFSLFNTSDLLVFPSGDALSMTSSWMIMGYGVLYIGVLLGLAAMIFQQREV